MANFEHEIADRNSVRTSRASLNKKKEPFFKAERLDAFPQLRNITV
jgi:hypothetical protein